MLLQMEARWREFIERHRVAHLATVDAAGNPSVVPVCYALHGNSFYSALDDKPKALPPERLRRVQNIRSNPNVALVIDEYSEDWTKLAYLHVRGRAEILKPEVGEEHAAAIAALRQKYPQYHSMRIDLRAVIKLVPEQVRFWSAQAGC